ncbi:MAG: dipeptidase [Alphaproteobacteria bacterium]
MKRFIKGFLGLIVAVVLLGGGWFLVVEVPAVDRGMNVVTDHAPYPVSAEAQTLHDTLTVGDLHADALLWRRNPEKRYDRGHVDLPRLRDGGVDIQIFSAVTKSPRGLNFDGNSADAPDDIALLAKVQLWPLRTWDSIYERAAYQAQRLQKVEKRSKNNLKIVRSKSDLERDTGMLLGVLATEGSHPLEGKLENIDRLYDEGYRMMGLQHFFDNRLGGSLHGRTKGGLTDFGREAVLKMQAMDIMVDVAHSSEAVVRDVLALTPEPILISHGGLASYCPRTMNRNMPDDILIEIARRGGVIGIGYFDGAICDISPKGIAATIVAAVDLLGEDAVGLGSDFDGTVTTALDTSELAAITHELLKAGVPERTIRKVMGGNIERFLSENLPE